MQIVTSFPYEHLELCPAALLSEELILHAYCTGFFPMAEGEGLIRWHSPDPRAIFPLTSMQTSKSLRKSVAKAGFEMRVDTVFDQVIEACSRRNTADDVWISDELIEVYGQLHQRGVVHSVETWSEGELVGGLYGVSIGTAFFGESMFSVVSNASKAAFVYLFDVLTAQGYTVLDTQYLNHFTERLGAIEVPKSLYHVLLAEALQQLELSVFSRV